MSRENTDRKYNLIVKHMHTNWYIMKNIDLQDGIWNHNPLKLNLCCNARRLSIRNITASCCEFKFDHPVVFTFCTGPSKTSHSHWRSKIKAISFHFRCQIYVLLHQKLSEYQSFPFVTVQADILHSFSGRRFVFISTQLSYMFSTGLSHPCFFSRLHICHLQDGKLNISWDLESSLWNAVLPSLPWLSRGDEDRVLLRSVQVSAKNLPRRSWDRLASSWLRVTIAAMILQLSRLQRQTARSKTCRFSPGFQHATTHGPQSESHSWAFVV